MRKVAELSNDELLRAIQLASAELAKRAKGEATQQVPIIEESSDSAQSRLKAAGELLYGTRWQSDLARAVGVGDRRVREWAAGERRTPPGVWVDIAGLLRDRQTEIEAMLSNISHH